MLAIIIIKGFSSVITKYFSYNETVGFQVVVVVVIIIVIVVVLNRLWKGIDRSTLAAVVVRLLFADTIRRDYFFFQKILLNA